MKENHSLEMIGIQNTTGKVHYNLNPARLVEEALRRGEVLFLLLQASIQAAHRKINLSLIQRMYMTRLPGET